MIVLNYVSYVYSARSKLDKVFFEFTLLSCLGFVCLTKIVNMSLALLLKEAVFVLLHFFYLLEPFLLILQLHCFVGKIVLCLRLVVRHIGHVRIHQQLWSLRLLEYLLSILLLFGHQWCLQIVFFSHPDITFHILLGLDLCLFLQVVVLCLSKFSFSH